MGMITITFIQPDGSQTVATAKPGGSLMQAAVDHGVKGIVGECGGSMACATCHCHVDSGWRNRTGAMSPGEADMLELSAGEVRPESRLACQITLTPELDGLVIRLPEQAGT